MVHEKMLDLRSDTVTKPTAPMREAMARAEVGDDVYGEDPTVRALEARTAALLGKEAALFVPSGTMGNQLALLVSTRRGDEVIVGEGAHIAWYESGAGAALAGVQFATAGHGGLFTADEMEAAAKPEGDHYPRTSLVAVENTHNRAGGRLFPKESLREIVARARARGYRLHLDGARLWNASVATGLTPSELAEGFDTVSVCFSKGLGAPIGSALVASRADIQTARRHRKMLGGGMRQVGVLAAAALYALDHHLTRLADDHAHARLFSEALRRAVSERPAEVSAPETNIVNVSFPRPLASAVVEEAKRLGLLIGAVSPHRLRIVFHLGANQRDATLAAELLARAIDSVCGAC